MSETPLNNCRKKQVNLEAFLTEFLTIKKKKSTLYYNSEVRQLLLKLFSRLVSANTPKFEAIMAKPRKVSIAGS